MSFIKYNLILYSYVTLAGCFVEAALRPGPTALTLLERSWSGEKYHHRLLPFNRRGPPLRKLCISWVTAYGTRYRFESFELQKILIAKKEGAIFPS